MNARSRWERRARRRLVTAALAALALAPVGVVALGAQTASAATATTTTISTPGTATYFSSASLTATVMAGSGANPTSGTVVISDSFGDFNCTVTLSGTNYAICATGYTAVGTDTVSATYEASGSFGTSTATASVAVAPASVTLSASATPATVGQTTTVTVESTPALGANRGGTLTISDGLGALDCATTLANGASAQCTSSSFTGIGTDTVTASWTGNADYNPATTETTLGVTRASTLVASVTAPASQVGQAATITVQINPHPDGGNVQISDADAQVTGCASVPVDVSTGQAICTTGTLTAADLTDAISAQYLGDPDFAASPVAGATLEIDRGATQLVVSASPGPSVGATATYLATLSPSQAFAGGGSVAFSDTSSKLTDCAAQPIGSSTSAASCQSLAYTSVASDTVSAAFGGNGDWAPSSGSQAFSVAPGSSSLAATVSPSRPTVGQEAVITAVVSPTDGGGTVAFTGPYLSGCSAAPLISDVATCTSANFVAAGSWSPIITYSGDANYAAGNSVTEVVAIAPAPTTVVLVSSPSSPVAFGPDTLVATVSPVPDGGTVTFSDPSGTLAGCSNVAVDTTSGVASCPVADLPGAGSDDLMAVYSGDANYLSTNGQLALGIQKIPTTALISASPTSLGVGQAATITITISPVPDGGTASVTDSFGDLACSAVAIETSGAGAGTATCTTGPLSSAGADTLVASFSGTANDTPATGSGSIAVERLVSRTQVSSADAVGVVGQDLHLVVTVTPAPAGGTVSFSDSLGQLGVCASEPVDASSATASCTSGALTRTGPDIITATFEQTATESSSSASTSIAMDQQPSFSGPLTLTDTVGGVSTAVLETSGYPAPVVAAGAPLPGGLALGANGAITGTPAFGSGGHYDIPVTATNALGSTSATLELVVDQAPAISSATILEAAYGTEANFAVTTAAGTYPSATFALSGAVPSGMSFVDNHDGTASITGAPNDGSGPHRFSLVVTNAAGSCVVGFSIDVIASSPPPPPPPTAVSPASNAAALPSLDRVLALHRSEAVASAGRQPSVSFRGALPATWDPIAATTTARRTHGRVKRPIVALGEDRRFPVLGNVGPYGDCAVVADSNIVRVDHLSGRLRKVPAMTTNEALRQWRAINGGSGAGLTDVELLHAWSGPAGVLGTRLSGWRLLDAEDIAGLKRAIRASGALYAGVVLPSDGVAGSTINPRLSATTPVSGHALALLGWTSAGFLGVSWGEVVLIPYRWWARYATTAYALRIVATERHGRSRAAT